jgi:hypothetical protein
VAFTRMVVQFPPELLLELFKFFPLKTLFAGRGVNRQWNKLIPMTDMLPARRVLYDLYYSIIKSPSFIAGRTLIMAQSPLSFSREKFIRRLESDGGGGVVGRDRTFPDEFRCYILEWPEKAIIGWFWPTLDPGFTMSRPGKPHGSNALADHDRRIEEIIFFYPAGASPYPPIEEDELDPFFKEMRQPGEVAVSVNALQVWYHGCTMYSWLIVDVGKPSLHGKIYLLDGFHVPSWGRPHRNGWVEWLTSEEVTD